MTRDLYGLIFNRINYLSTLKKKNLYDLYVSKTKTIKS